MLDRLISVIKPLFMSSRGGAARPTLWLLAGGAACGVAAVVWWLRRPRLPGLRVLVVGDGDFSFTAAAARQPHLLWPAPETALAVTEPLKAEASLVHQRADNGVQLVATTLDDLDTVFKRYGDEAREAVRAAQRGGAVVLGGVDATQLPSSLHRAAAGDDAASAAVRGGFDRVVWNFPHHGGKGRIQANRALLADFFGCVGRVLRDVDDAEVQVALAAGQGGTPVEHRDARRAVGDTWQIVEQAAASGFVLAAVHEFRPVSGYRSVGRRSKASGFRTARARTHVFRREGRGVEPLFPPTHVHDVTFWVDDEAVGATAVRAVVARVAADAVADDGVQLIDEWRHPSTARRSLCFRVTYRSETAALGAAAANRLQMRVRDELVASLGVELR